MVTGGAGFVGSHLVDRLVADGQSVLVIDDLSSGRATNLPDTVRLEKLDVSTDAVAAVVDAWRPAIVYHLAAQTSVPRSMEDPLRDLSVNVAGTHRTVAAAHACGVARLVFVSSGGAVYGETPRAASEATRPAPTSYYGIHKLAAEGHVALSGIPHAIVRPSNIYGPRQSGGLEGADARGEDIEITRRLREVGDVLRGHEPRHVAGPQQFGIGPPHDGGSAHRPRNL